jgi:predicted Ser/Thr protein kinase
VDVPADAPEDLCPSCLMRHGLSTADRGPSASPGESGPVRWGPFLPPEPAELARYFPQLEVLQLLGQGGMGAVYKARQKGLDRLVALKILPLEVGRNTAFAERFTREAKALARLNHPNIVAIYDVGQIGGLYYFLMEYVDGVNLRQALRAGQLQPQQALQIVPQLCEALEYAHEEGIVHRDIKPENILLDKRGRVKIADFGLVKLLGRSAAEARLTAPYQVMGTPHYMAPEQVENPLEVDHRADIYSLGVVFYEMLTGQLPLGRFAPPSQKVQVDVRIDEVVLKTLEREPRRRYQHASEIKTDVESLRGAPPARWQGPGAEYRSKATLFGLPLVHIATGYDPATGKQRVAKGIIAIGDLAVGVLAIGGGAFGGIALGGGAIGLLSFGGFSIGLLVALGGLAVGGLAFGGGAIGVIAVGGGALGYYAFGGQAWGVHALGGTANDPEAVKFFEGIWKDILTRQDFLAWMFIAMAVCFTVMMLGMLIAAKKPRQKSRG